jgi:hypothetical protein
MTIMGRLCPPQAEVRAEHFHITGQSLNQGTIDAGLIAPHLRASIFSFLLTMLIRLLNIA